MAYKLQIVDQQNGASFNARYENLAKKPKLEIIAKAPNGDIVKEKMCYQGKPINEGDSSRRWMNDKGQEYAKSELTFYYGEQVVGENEQTKVFEIEGFQPLSNYTDRYVISAYYEVFPSDNDMKKPLDKEKAIAANLHQMRKLWEYLHEKEVVARGEFCPSSRGFVASDGYIRAIQVDQNKWGLEIGCFKEEKIFQHIQEPSAGTAAVEMPSAVAQRAKTKLKLV